MRGRKRVLFFSGSRLKAAGLWFFLFFALGLGCEACFREWRVVRVVDGDTVWVRRGPWKEKVRLKGVDAPEIPHPDYGQLRLDPYGYESRECLARMVEGETVRIGFATPDGSPERDKYGRLLAYIFDGNTLVNEELIRRGCARAFHHFQHPYLARFLALEREARKNRRGLWAYSSR